MTVAEAGAARGADEAEIRRLVEGLREALRNKDADAVAARCAADVLVYDLAPPLRSRGADVEAEKLRAWFATWRGPVDHTIHGLRVEVGGAIAYATGLARLRGTKLDGSEQDVWSRVTLGFRKTDKGWRMAHHHESVPFHMDGSLRAAVDLAPEP